VVQAVRENSPVGTGLRGLRESVWDYVPRGLRGDPSQPSRPKSLLEIRVSHLSGDSTLAEVQARWPSAPYTLFARFGIGSREKLGFRPDQKLSEVLARYLVFDVQRVLEVLESTEDTYRELYCSAEQAQVRSFLWIDVRGQDEHDLGARSDWSYLTGELAGKLFSGDRVQPILFFCRSGALAPAAAQHFRHKGYAQAFALQGGLESWTGRFFPEYPVYGQNELEAGRINLLALRSRAVWLLDAPIEPGVRKILRQTEWDFGPAKIWLQRDRVVIDRSSMYGWLEHAPKLLNWLKAQGWRDCSSETLAVPELKQALAAVVAGPVQEMLQSHKGSIDLVSIKDEVASLSLGGGCQGCSSAAITINQEIAEVLYRECEELLGVIDATPHQAEGATPHH
jgi:Fe-S cluster biogenesis protein NfuA/rhodanese-related sulfurtransferase